MHMWYLKYELVKSFSLQAALSDSCSCLFGVFNAHPKFLKTRVARKSPTILEHRILLPNTYLYASSLAVF